MPPDCHQVGKEKLPSSSWNPVREGYAWFTWAGSINPAQVNQASFSDWSILLRQIRHLFPPWLPLIRQIRQTFQAWSILLIKSGKPACLINPTQENQAIRQMKESCEKSNFTLLHHPPSTWVSIWLLLAVHSILTFKAVYLEKSPNWNIVALRCNCFVDCGFIHGTVPPLCNRTTRDMREG